MGYNGPPEAQAATPHMGWEEAAEDDVEGNGQEEETMNRRLAKMTATLSTTHGIVFRKGMIIELVPQETNAGQRYGVLFPNDSCGDLFVPVDERWFSILEDD